MVDMGMRRLNPL